jgi:hypothetical protein
METFAILMLTLGVLFVTGVVAILTLSFVVFIEAANSDDRDEDFIFRDEDFNNLKKKD